MTSARKGAVAELGCLLYLQKLFAGNGLMVARLIGKRRQLLYSCTGCNLPKVQDVLPQGGSSVSLLYMLLKRLLFDVCKLVQTLKLNSNS